MLFYKEDGRLLSSLFYLTTMHYTTITLTVLIFLTATFSESLCQSVEPGSNNSKIMSGSKGLHGYISYYSPKPPEGYGVGVSFYSAVWPLIDKPLANFQIGLPSTWIIPENSEVDFPLCPVGTLARNWEPRGPSWATVFQTVEGGLGYWRGNHFRYASPKFSMNGIPSCYDYEVASPGWSFFYSDTPLADEKMGIAQLSNRILVPPDGMTFQGKPNGEFLGYAWMALPLMDGSEGPTPTGDQSWTLFLNSKNFKGAVAYYIAETWTKIAEEYPIATGHTLDVRPGVTGAGAMEINTVPKFELEISTDSTYYKIPALQFPVDEQERTILVQDVKFYSKKALYDSFKAWRDGEGVSSGAFNQSGVHEPTLTTRKTKFDQDGKLLAGVDDLLATEIYPGNVFGIRWDDAAFGEAGKFPQYFLDTGGEHRVPVAAENVPAELVAQDFELAPKGAPYTSPKAGAWVKPGPASGPREVVLADGSTVTYCWYRFIDQPSLQQFDWSPEEREKLQALVEKIHANWGTDDAYMEPQTQGELVAFDEALLVAPPVDYELGYVPIVIGQK